jgi:predicted DNA-binding transcriptional regulator YafY
VLDTLTRAWSEQRRVKLWYSAPQSGEAMAREFATYFIEPTPDGDLYVVGFDTLSRQVRALNLRQIKRVKPLPHVYEIPPISELQYFLANSARLNVQIGT